MNCGIDNDSNEDGSSSTGTQNEIESAMVSWTWRITKFIDSGDDESSYFAGYNFEFNANDTVRATNGTASYQGTWSNSDSHINDDILNKLDFNSFFNFTKNFEELNDDRDFISQSSTKIELYNIGDRNGGPDHLTFEKN